jgi:alpha-beta hydrolase superfamily lysophospholipase
VTLTQWLDPSVTDEQHPNQRDKTLDIYADDCPAKPPFSDAFVARFREAQIERNRRITRWVQQQLAALREAGHPHDELGFVVHRTMCDVRWIDSTQDPNDRQPNWCFMGEPRQVNNSPAGLARFCTLRSWLSQWSYDLSRANGVVAAADVKVPCLQIYNSADDGCMPSHADQVFAALASNDKEAKTIKGANHYYFGQPEHAARAAEICKDWLERHQLI